MGFEVLVAYVELHKMELDIHHMDQPPPLAEHVVVYV